MITEVCINNYVPFCFHLLVILSTYITEDVLQFKQDIDAIVKYLSRIRGKKNDSIVLAAHFETLLQEFFPDVFHNSAAAEPEKKPHIKNSSASKEKPVEESTSSSTRKRPRSDIEPAEVPAHVEEPPVVSDRRRGSSGKADSLPVQSSSAGSKLTAAQKVNSEYPLYLFSF